LWHNRLCIAISPDRISMVRLGRGLKPKLLGKHDEAISASGKQSSWQAAVERLAQILAEPEWKNADVDIVLSNRLAQYAAITFDSQLKKYPEQEAYARHVLNQTYGPHAAQWELRIQRGKDGGRWLVSAVELSLLEGLRQACAAHNLGLRSVTPYLMPVFNRFRNGIKADPAWLVINEPGHSLIVLLNKGEFATINGVSHANTGELPKLLDRENLICGLSQPCKTIYLHALSDDFMPGGGGYEFIPLEPVRPKGYPAASEGLFALAMGGGL
jgi:hypothetical protein